MDDGDGGSRSPLPSPSPSPPRNSISAAANSVSVAAAAIAELQNQPPLAAALPIQNPRRPSHSPAAAAASPAGREDCWSEGATAALVEAWSERFLELGRGSLKQTHWKEVADAVRSRQGAHTKKPHKSDAQYKNRIDTLKKKYRTEKTKVCLSPSYTSPWPFFDRMDLLLGPIYKPSLPSSTRKAPAAAAAATKLTQKPRTPVARKRKASPLATAGNEDGGAMEGAEKESSESLPSTGARRRSEGMRELAMAVARLGEVYERVERLRMEMTEEVERLRASFTKEMELQRMEFFAKTQMEIAQFKKLYDGSGGGSGSGDEELRWNGDGGRRGHYHQNNGSKNSNSHSSDDC